MATCREVIFENEYPEQLLDIGGGKIEVHRNTQCITLAADFCVLTSSKEELIGKVFPDISDNYRNHEGLSERAILAPTNCDVNAINLTIQSVLPGDVFIYN